MLRNGKDSGLVRCTSGEIHRVRSEVCDLPGSEELALKGCTKPDGTSYCGDCSGTPGGYCAFVPQNNIAGGTCTCRTGCVQDSDCPAGTACECRSDGDGKLIGSCSPAQCRVGSECDSGRCLSGSLSCVMDGDECTTFSHCDADQECSGSAGKRECTDAVVSGRPFWQEGRRREAPLVPLSWG